MASKPKYYIVKLPCKSYVRKYINFVHGFPVPAHNKSSMGCFVNACLEKQLYTDLFYSNSFIHKFNDMLTFQISSWAFKQIGFDFPKAKIIEINRFLEAVFEEHLYQWVDARYEKGKNERRDLIEQFAERFSIHLEDDLAGHYKADISLDALVKTEYRYRIAIERNVQKAKELSEKKQVEIPKLFY